MEVLKKFVKSEAAIYLLLALVSFIMFFYNLGSYKLIDVDEPRYAEAAREMIASHNWITPYFNYELRFDKPVMFYWLIAGAYKVFGVNEFAARFPSAVMATLLVFLTYLFGKSFISRRYGVISSLILASSLEFLGMARMSITDMTLAFFICAAIISGLVAVNYESIITNKKYIPKTLWWWLAYIFSAFGVLTKGPVGIMLPGLVVGIYALFTGKLKDCFKFKYLIPGLAVFSAISIPWYWIMIKIHGQAFFDYFFLKHNLERFASSKFGQHQQPFYFYIFVILGGCFPWTFFFISALSKYLKTLCEKVWSARNEILRLRFAIFKDSENSIKTLLASTLWFFIIFLFYSSSKAKLITYILPIFPASALLTGFLINEHIKKPEIKKYFNIPVIATVITIIIAALVVTLNFNLVLPREVRSDSIHLFWLVPAVFFIPSLISFWNYKRAGILKTLLPLFIMMMLIIPVAQICIMPIVYNAGPKDLYNYTQFVKNLPAQKKQLVTYELTKPSIIFYYQQKVPDIALYDYNSLGKVLIHKNSFIIAKTNKVADLLSRFDIKLLNKGKKYSLLGNVNIKYTKESL